jgi:PIN domain nuclease of toxin-antitoxin system
VITLMDTHTFLWWDGEPSRLSPQALKTLQDPSCTVLLSVVSIWEILIKSQLGKLSLRLPLSDIVSQQVANGVKILPVTLEHSLGLESLPAVHKDPFDRLLIAQARVEGATLLSADHIFAQYPVHFLW